MGPHLTEQKAFISEVKRPVLSGNPAPKHTWSQKDICPKGLSQGKLLFCFKHFLFPPKYLVPDAAAAAAAGPWKACHLTCSHVPLRVPSGVWRTQRPPAAPPHPFCSLGCFGAAAPRQRPPVVPSLRPAPCEGLVPARPAARGPTGDVSGCPSPGTHQALARRINTRAPLTEQFPAPGNERGLDCNLRGRKDSAATEPQHYLSAQQQKSGNNSDS